MVAAYMPRAHTDRLEILNRLKLYTTEEIFMTNYDAIESTNRFMRICSPHRARLCTCLTCTVYLEADCLLPSSESLLATSDMDLFIHSTVHCPAASWFMCINTSVMTRMKSWRHFTNARNQTHITAANL
jgi:hypothetical protein